MKIEDICWLISILLIFSFVLSSTTIVLADYNPVPEPKDSVEEAVKKANEEIGFPYYDVSKVNREVYEKYGVLVYGKPSGDKDSKGEYRYLGTMPDGTEFTNYNRMHDAWAGGVLDTRNWIAEPWGNKDTRKKGARENEWNGNNPEWNSAIIAGMKYAYGDGITSGAIGDWTKYVQILQPPTADTWGMGRMWHKLSNGQIWYITFPIAPLEMDILIKEFLEEDILEPNPIVIPEPRSLNVAIKWDKVPLKLKDSSTLTAKVKRDSKNYTWNRYEIEVHEVFQGTPRRKPVKIKTIGYNKDFMLKKGSTWFDLKHDGKAKYTAPTNGKPGTTLTAKLTVWSRIDNPNIPKPPKSPKPPKMPAPKRLIEQYELEKKDYAKLSEVYSSYFKTKNDKQPTRKSPDGYKAKTSYYRSTHRQYNRFLDNHIKRYVSIEGGNKSIYWFTKKEKNAKAEAKNTIVHIPENLQEGGLDPSIIVNPPKPPKVKK